MPPRPVVFAVVLVAASAHAERLPAGPGGLAGLVVPHRSRAQHASSADPTGGNVDFRPIAPGTTLTLLDHKGGGVVHRFWMTFYPRASLGAPPEKVVAAHRQMILRMYWDGEDTPSVEVPVGDFFGVGFGEQRDYVSLPLSETSGGYNCYWPMPFHRSARWTLTNLSDTTGLVWWNIDFTAERGLPKATPHFHAQWRRENPTTAGQSYTILDAHGTGHFAGTALFLHGLGPGVPPYGPLVFLEGDEQITVDGAATPLVGTGTEDYFDGGFYFDHGPIAAPYAGAVIRDEAGARVSAYRWHIEDAIPFAKSIHVAIEHGPVNDVPTDYSSVAYFYQTEPHAPFPPLPDAAGLLP
jgi:hypothetical protein